MAATEALGIQSVLSDFGTRVKIEIHSDATAAIGICKRQGLGRVRHLAQPGAARPDAVRQLARHMAVHGGSRLRRAAGGAAVGRREAGPPSPARESRWE